MYGQTSRAYQMLIDAYHTVLERMHGKNLVLPMAMLMGLGATLAPKARADEVYAGAGSLTDVHQGTQRGLIIYFDAPGDPTMDVAPNAGFGTQEQALQHIEDGYRAYYAGVSGGKFDVQYDIVNLPVTPPSGGGSWSGVKAAAAALLPSMGYTISDYSFVTAIYSPNLDTSMIASLPGGVGDVRVSSSPASQTWAYIAGAPSGGPDSGYYFHEFGHTLGLSHAGSIDYDNGSLPRNTGAAPAYTYDYTTRQYVSATVPNTNSYNYTLPDFAIGGTGIREYGSNYDVMATNRENEGLSPREKQSLGWMDKAQFTHINQAVAPNTTSIVKLYDDMASMRVVTTGTEANQQYGVAQGYQHATYDAYITRQAQTFHVNPDGTTGQWVNYTQTLDFYYRTNEVPYPGQDPTPDALNKGIVMQINGLYAGYIAPGQTLLEKDIDQSLFIPFMSVYGADGTRRSRNLDDGSDIPTNASKDIMTYNGGNPGAPTDPNRYRQVWYKLTYVDDSSDSVGYYANLKIEALTGAQVTGWQWDPNAGTNGSQDGSGTWTTGSGNWHNIGTGLDNQNWTAGEDAVFGAGAGGGAAGTVTLGGNISAASLTFQAPGSGHYTIEGNGNTLSVGYGGIFALDSTTINAPVALSAPQIWEVAGAQTLTVNGTVTTAGNTLTKFGQGTLALGSANTWVDQLTVSEGTVRQGADQTFASGKGPVIGQGGVYEIASGTLILDNNSNVAGPSNINMGAGLYGGNSGGTLPAGQLLLSSTASSTSNPDILFNGGGAIRADVALSGIGQHVITTSTSAPTISGDISGVGGITLYAGSTAASNRLQLSGTNTFTGDIELERGSLHLVGTDSLQGNNVLRFNTASGDTARFYLRGNNRAISDLSSNSGAGSGTAIIANAQGARSDGTSNAATLVVTQNNAGTYAGSIVDTSNDSGGSGNAGALGLTKQGNAMLTLTGNNTYSGGTVINAGTLRVGGSGSIGSGAVTLSGGSLSIDQRQGLSLTRLGVGGSGMDTTTAVAGGGAYTSDFSPLHTPASTLIDGTFAYSGKIFLTAGQWSFGKSFDDGAYLNIDGTQLFSNSNYYDQAYGTMSIAADDWYDIDLRLYNTGGGGPYANGTWDNVKGIGIKQGDSTGGGAAYTAFNPGALGIQLRDLNRVSNAVILTAAGSTVEILDQDSIQAESVFSGGITGSGGLTKTGSGTLTLAGTGNTYAGATTVLAGTFAAGNANAFSAVSAVTLANASSAALDLRGFDQTVGSLAGGGASGGNVMLGTGTLTTGGNNADASYDGVISGVGALVKTGTGTQTLTRAQGYTGGTTVNGGTLRLDFSGSASVSNLLDTSAALTLGGGALELNGANGGANMQAFGGVNLTAGTHSAVRITANGASTADLQLNNIAVGSGATLDFQGGSGDTVSGGRFSFTTINGGVIGTGAKLGNFATWNGADWAANTGVSDGAGGFYIGAYTGYANIYNGTGSGTVIIPNTPGADVKILESSSGWGHNTLTGDTTANSLLMSANGHGATVDMTASLTTNAIAVANGAKGLTLGVSANQGTLTSGTPSLTLISNNAAAADGLFVNARITGSTGAVVSGGTGGGTVVFAGDNDYSGGTRVVAGATLRVGNDASTGNLGSGAVALDLGTRLAFNRSDAALIVGNSISGGGTLAQIGSGTTTLTGNNAYGATTVSAGTLIVGNGGATGTLGFGDAAIASGATLAFNRDSLTVSNTLTGAGTVAQVGGGTTVLTAANAYGATTVSAGTLQIGNGTTVGTLGSGSVTLTGGTLAINHSDTVTLSNTLSGAGSLAQVGSGTTVLTANNIHGATTVSGGTLQVGDGGTVGTLGAGAVTNNAALAFNRSNSLTVAGAISGSGTLAQIGAGTTVLTSSANAWTGAATISNGTLQIGDATHTGSIGSGSVSVSDGSTLAFAGNGTVTMSGAISGPGNILQSGTGTTILTNANMAYYGTATISAGTLQIGNGGTTGAIGSGTVANSGTLAFNRSDTVTLSGALSGSGALRQMGPGTLVLSAANTYQGTTTIDAVANLQVGSGGSGGTLGAGNVVDNGTLTFNRSNNYSVSNVISDGGSLVQSGTAASRTRLSGANTYAGGTTVSSGTLSLVSTTSGGTIGTLGSGAVTLSGGNLAVAPGSTSNAYAVSNVIHVTASSKIGNDDGQVTFTGPVDIASGATLTAGTAGWSGKNLTLSGGINGIGNLAIQANGLALNGGGTSTNGRVFISSATTFTGTTTVTSGDLRLSDGNALQASTFVGGGGGTVSFDSAVSSRAFTFGGLTGTGNIALANTASSAIALTVNNAVDNTYDGTLSGSGSLVKSNTGTLTLTHASAHAGGTTVSGGTLALDFSQPGSVSSNILPSSGAVTLNGGTLKIIGTAGQNGTVQSFASLSSGSANSTLELVQNGATSLDVDVGAMSFGAGTLNFVGLTGTTAGARVITSADAGGNDGATQLSATSALWEGTGWASVQDVSGTKYVVQWTGTYTALSTNGDISTNPAGDIKIVDGSGSGTAATYDTDTTLNSLLMTASNFSTAVALGGHTLTVGAAGSGNLAIGTGAQSLAIGAGTLTSGTSGAAMLNLANNGAAGSTLTVDAAIANNPGGAVSVVVGGSGPVVFNGTNTYTGATTLNSGADLSINSINGIGNATADASNLVLNGATLRYTGATASTARGMTLNNTGNTLDTASDLTLSGQLVGAGDLTKIGGGALTLSGANTHTGPITVNGGMLKAGSTGALAGLPAVVLANTAGVGLDITGFNTQIGSLAGGGASGGNVTLGSNTLTVGGDGTSTTYAGVIGGTGGLVRTGGGTLTLAGANNYTGTTTVNGSSLRVVDGGSLGTGQVTLGANAILTYDMSMDTTVSNTLNIFQFTGSNPPRTLRSDGNGALIWTGNTTSGGSSLPQEFRLGGVSTAANTFAGIISPLTGGGGTESLRKQDAGTWRLSGNNAYDGNTTVAAGILEIAADNALGAATLGTSVSDGATLRLVAGVNYTATEAVSINGTGMGGIGAFTTTGGTTTFAGRITAASNATLSSGGGTLNLTGGLVKNGTTLTLTGGGRINISGVGISGSNPDSDLVVDGAGVDGPVTVDVMADSNYNGPTTVKNGGVLLANAQIITTDMTVNTGGVLGGTSTVTASGAFLIASDGLITGGEVGTVGDLTIASDAVNLYGTYVFDVDYAATGGVGDADTLSFASAGATLDFNGFSMQLNSGTGTGNATYSIKLMEWDATDTLNNFAVADGGTLVPGGSNGLTANQTVVRRGNALYLENFALVPEPASGALLGLGVLLLLRRPTRRRRRAKA